MCAARKKAAKKAPSRRKSASGSTGSNTRARYGVVTTENDNFSRGFESLVPDEFRDTPGYLNILQWNIEWFGARKSVEKDKERFGAVVEILGALNADLFVFQEIAGPSSDGRYPGVLDAVAEELTQKGLGHYVVYYTEAGGEQRVAMMWDQDWIRAKREAHDLFERGTHLTDDGKDAFAGRTPLRGYFSARLPGAAGDAPGEGSDKFDFQVLGVHLKAMTEGAAQRLESAKVLAEWLEKEAPKTDHDALIMGDWNAPPGDDCWKPFHDLERKPGSRVRFTDINDASDFSYLWLANRSAKYVSRIDLTAVSLASETPPPQIAGKVVRWNPIQEVIARAGSLTAKEVADVLKQVKESVSDHLPTATRFYLG